MGITAKVKGEVVGTGDVTVPFRQIYKVVKKLPAGEFEIKQDGHTLRIISGKMKYGLEIMDAKEFPEIPVSKKKAIFTITGECLKALLRKTVFAVSDDPTRFVLSGIRVELCKGHIQIVATDGSRMVVFKNSSKAYSYKQEKKMAFILPGSAVRSLIKMVDIYGGTVSFVPGETEKDLFFSTGDTIVKAIAIEGNYPTYAGIVKDVEKNKLQISLHRAVLIEAIKSVAVGDVHGSGCKFTFDKGTLVLSTKSSDMGEISNEIDVEYKGSLTVGYNYQYVLQALDTLDTEHVTFHIKDSFTGLLITGYENKENIKHVVMPFKVDK